VVSALRTAVAQARCRASRVAAIRLIGDLAQAKPRDPQLARSLGAVGSDLLDVLAQAWPGSAASDGDAASKQPTTSAAMHGAAAKALTALGWVSRERLEAWLARARAEPDEQSRRRMLAVIEGMFD
jgi:hypothetical protein